MPDAIHDWKDTTKYLPDPLANAPAEFIAEHKGYGHSQDEMRATLWRWQFLRRHPLYQDKWEDGSEEYTGLFDLCDVPRPHPKDDFPAGLLFSSHMVPKGVQVPAIIDLRESWSENVRKLKWKYNFYRMVQSPLSLFYFPKPKPPSKRKRQLGERKYPNLVRVLDALATNASLTEIAKELRENVSSESLTKTAARLRKQALQLQHELTQLPTMELREK